MIAQAKRPIRRSRPTKQNKENEIIQIITKYGLESLPETWKTPTQD